jgi:hypothetical protein
MGDAFTIIIKPETDIINQKEHDWFAHEWFPHSWRGDIQND